MNIPSSTLSQSNPLLRPCFQRVALACFLALLAWMNVLAEAQDLGPAPHSPSLQHPPLSPGKLNLSVLATNRQAVVEFYHTTYKAAQGIPHEWNGNIANCIPGRTSQAYLDATILRINYYRAMAGLPGNVVSDATWNGKAQMGALMMSAHGQLSHAPGSTWTCYSEQGAEAAGSSNLSLGVAGPAAIDLYMDDPGPNNTPVGHRRWILYPPQKVVGVGNVPAVSGNFAANALWVIGGVGPRPPAPEFVAWPPPGFVPYQIMPRISGRWSFSMKDAVFTNTVVTMSAFGTNIPVSLEPLWQGYGDNSLIWRPSGIPYSAPARDTTYSVTISNVTIGLQKRSFTYNVTIIDPEVPALSIVRNGPDYLLVSWPATEGAYRLFVSTGLQPTNSWAPWPETPIFSSNRYVVHTPITNGTRFFRLQP